MFFKQNPQTCEAASFIFDQARKCRKSKSYKSQIRRNANKIREFEKSRGIVIMSNSMNLQMCDDFHDFLLSKNYLENTITAIMSKTFASFKLMKKAGYLISEEFEEFQLLNEEITTIYLSSEEIERIYDLKVRTQTIAIIRDLFVIACLTGLRYSDLTSLNDKNYQGGIIVYACRLCEKSKGDLMPYDWLQYLSNHPLVDKTTLERVKNAVTSLYEIDTKITIMK